MVGDRLGRLGGRLVFWFVAFAAVIGRYLPGARVGAVKNQSPVDDDVPAWLAGILFAAIGAVKKACNGQSGKLRR